jgi:adenosylcobinamide-GDP ribazoletransferase
MTSFVAKIGALSTLPRSQVLVAMIATHALARAPLAVLAAAMPYARADGLAASAGRPDSLIALTACVVAAVIALVALPAATVMTAAFVTAVTAASLAALAQQQIGGTDW